MKALVLRANDASKACAAYRMMRHDEKLMCVKELDRYLFFQGRKVMYHDSRFDQFLKIDHGTNFDDQIDQSCASLINF